MWVAFAFANDTFFSKNTYELDIVLTWTVNILTTNELVKLTVLWTTGSLTKTAASLSKDDSFFFAKESFSSCLNPFSKKSEFYFFFLYK